MNELWKFYGLPELSFVRGRNSRKILPVSMSSQPFNRTRLAAAKATGQSIHVVECPSECKRVSSELF